MKVSIVPFSLSNQKAVQHFVIESLASYGFGYDKNLDSDLDNPDAFYIQKGGMFYVLKEGNKIIGTVAIINKGNGIAELKRLYVHKDYQEKGFGSALLDKALEFAEEKSFTKMEFETSKKFVKAHLLYQRRDFNIVKEDENSYYMEKEV